MAGETIHVWICMPNGSFAQVVARELGPGYEVRRDQDFGRANARAQEKWCDVVVLGVGTNETNPSLNDELRLMEEINSVEVPPPIIAMLAEDTRDLMLKVMENGAYDSIVNPPNMWELRLLLRRAFKFRQVQKELFNLRSTEKSATRLHELIGTSEAMQQVFALAQKISPCDVSTLITGETGTGKELLARAIHRLSPRAAGPFVGFSCANLPETLVEDELFGHERGAFTGAIATRHGRFEAADQGTLFLDEIGDLGLSLQAKLLRILQEHSFERLGSNATVKTNIRLICATHRNLAEMVQQGKFREDLYYRLNVIQIHLPTLSERRDDIPLLANHFLRQFAEKFRKKTRRLSPCALHALEEYEWPGNVRELENVVQRGLALAEGSTIEVRDLPPRLRNGFDGSQIQLGNSYEEEVRSFKRRLILRTLRDSGFHKADTARTLGLARSYLHRLINQLQIQPQDADVMDDALCEPSASEHLM